MGIIDQVIKEPLGCAHFDPAFTAKEIAKAIRKHHKELADKRVSELLSERYDKFRAMGVFGSPGEAELESEIKR